MVLSVAEGADASICGDACVRGALQLEDKLPRPGNLAKMVADSLSAIRFAKVCVYATILASRVTTSAKVPILLRGLASLLTHPQPGLLNFESAIHLAKQSSSARASHH